MFEPFRAAPTGAKIANVLILLFLFLSWVSTMVTFGSVLHKQDQTFCLDTGCSATTTSTLNFYWDHYTASGGYLDGSRGPYNSDFSSVVFPDTSNNCKQGGDATLAFAIFAFLAFLIHIPLAVCRVAGLNFPMARDTQHSLYIELVLSSIELFCFFLQCCIWGGSCYSPSRSVASPTGVGFGLIIACFFFLLINEVLYFMMRTNDNLVMGNGATRGGGGSSGAYSSDPAGGDYGGGGDSASQPTFSYQGGSESAGDTL